MKIIVFGATGKTGLQVVRQALDAGHEVTAFVRDPARLQIHHPHLRVAVGQVTTDQEAVTRPLKDTTPSSAHWAVPRPFRACDHPRSWRRPRLSSSRR
jgi:nucleoside-diphosphate-sugar epimerase